MLASVGGSAVDVTVRTRALVAASSVPLCLGAINWYRGNRMPQQIPWGKLYSSPQQQVGALFYKVASVLGTPGGKDYSVRPSTDFPELPQPSDDLEILQRDFLRWGYCLVKDALDKNEVARATDRLLDQAEAERTAKVAQMGARQNNGPSWTGSRQLVSNLASKGEVWRDIATYQTHNGALIEAILTAALGKGMLLSSMHGVVVEQVCS